MGLAVRIIPTLLKRGSHLVKGKRFSADRVVGHVQQAARIHQARGVDELIILDVDARLNGHGPDFGAVEELTRDCFMPLTVGGGVRHLDDMNDLLRAGADKIAICTEALDTGYLRIERASKILGCQAIVASVDHVGNAATYICNGMTRTVYTAQELAIRYADEGAGEILLTSVAREGTMEGYDLETIAQVAHSLHIPVIAHGGCGTPRHALEAIQAGASAVAIGSMFLFSDETPASVARYLAEHNVEVRI